MSDYQGHFLNASQGHLYLACFGKLADSHVWLYLPPFAEEMNLSRAVVSHQARSFADRGEAVVCLDYYGTGDSEGELDQTNADLWLQDVCDTLAWIREQGAASVSLWGLRFGGLMALRFIAENPDSAIEKLLLWKPLLDGKLLMGQFFRLKQVSESMKGGAKVNWMARVAQGETVEVAGYPIAPSMLQSLVDMKLNKLVLEHPPTTTWLEAGANKIAASVEAVSPIWAGHKLDLQHCLAPAFWQNPDCYQAPELWDQSLQMTEGR
ncbi:MAG: CocE/NonD family hydrolase [Motiliproteus sp.]